MPSNKTPLKTRIRDAATAPFRWVSRPVRDVAVRVTGRVAYWNAHRNHRNILGDYAKTVGEALPLGKPNWAPVRKMYQSFARNVADVAYLLVASKRGMQRRFGADTQGLQHALRVGRIGGGGVVLAFPHFGTFGAQAAALSINGLPATLVAKRQAAPVQKVIERMCARTNVDLVTVESGPEAGRRVLEASEKALRDGRIVVMASDYARRGGRGGVKVTLAGTTRLVGIGPASLAMQTKSPVVCGVLLQDGAKTRLVTREPLSAEPNESIQTFTQRIADETTKLIAHDPAQWYPPVMVSNIIGRPPRQSRSTDLGSTEAGSRTAAPGGATRAMIPSQTDAAPTTRPTGITDLGR